MKKAAGVLLYRDGPGGLEVLLVHPSGNYNRKAPWSLPKGEPNEGETDMEVTARRETLEETNVKVTGPLVPLGTVKYQKSGKTIYAFAGPAADDMVPKVASWEIDQVRFVPLDEARRIMHPDQAAFLDRLVSLLK
jgi:predicted NUDIX family NTP pyrophosphohydrolase